MLSLFVKNCKNLSIPSPQPEIGGIPYCIALIYSVSILIASSSPLAFNSACSINLFSCSSQSTSSEYPFIISCPFTTNWNLSVNFGFSSLLLASGDKSIGCSIRYVGFIMFGLLTFLYNVSIKFPLPNCSKLSASSFIPFAFISASKLSAVSNFSISIPQSLSIKSLNDTTCHSPPKSISCSPILMFKFPSNNFDNMYIIISLKNFILSL